MPDNALGTAAESPHYVLDTCALLDGFDETLPAEAVVVLVCVLDELDAQKARGGEVGFNARVALKRIYERGYRVETSTRATYKDLFSTTDAKVALGEFGRDKGGIPVSSDVGVLLRARAEGREAINHRDLLEEPEAVRPSVNLKSAFVDVLVSAEFLTTFYAQKSCPVDPMPENLTRARFVNPLGHTALAWVVDGQAFLVDPKASASGVVPRDAGQAFAMDALLDDTAELVCLTGHAGTGKTFLTLAAGLSHQDHNNYGTLYAVRPIVPLGRDIGYLPGTKDEKMAPWAQVVWDTAEAIAPELTLEELVGKRSRYDIRVEPATYMRGRSIPGAILWIDEAQNMDIHELKTLLTRAGKDTKVILTGDIEQVDRKDLNKQSNGLARVIQQFAGWAGFRHVHLSKNHRSPLAAEAASRLG